MRGTIPPGSHAENPPCDSQRGFLRVRVNKRLATAYLLIAALGASALAAIIRHRVGAERLLARESELAARDVDRIASKRSVYLEKALPRSITFSDYLQSRDFDAATVQEIVNDARPIYNLGRVHAGNPVTIIRSGKGDLRAITYQIDEDRMLWITPEQQRFQAEIKPIAYDVVVAGVRGRIEDSLFEALTRQGEGDTLAMEMADIFGWDIDFYTDPQPGDTFDLLVEKKMLNGRRAGYGQVLAAEYQNAGQLHQALLFHDPSGEPAYYRPDGKSLKKAFLRSPLKFQARITSRFSYHRFHPILRRFRPHLGIDYGAPVGSPVQAVADGTVVSAGWSGDGGKEIRLRHANGYETYYLHLSRILVHRGERVHQGKIIGRVGATGLATGPHLDFRIRQHGNFRNFLALKLPPTYPVARQDWNDFVKLRAQLLDELSSVRNRHAGGPAQAALKTPDPNSGK
jgi:murein DD-endopeptidase MepM/ murein hydrolase activator NlpD